MVLIFILIYFGWRDTENQQFLQLETGFQSFILVMKHQILNTFFKIF